MSGFNTDSLPEKDLLGRKIFASEIAKSVIDYFQNGENSFVLGINGKWGSGKTTLMDYLKTAIKDVVIAKEKTFLIDFNPWVYSGKQELLQSLLDQMSDELEPRISNLKKKLSVFSKAVKHLEVVKYISPIAGEVQKAVARQIDEATKPVNLIELKSSIDQTIVSNKYRLFVFVDDVDRLAPDEVIEIFQIVKLNASFKNTVFIIFYDKEVVTSLLTPKLGTYAEKYLEKIVQVDYRIPDLLDEEVEAVFLESIREMFLKMKIKLNEEEIYELWKVHRLRFYFSTLRDVYRYVNAVKLRLPAIKDDIDPLHFLSIEAIRVFDYKAYEIIQRNFIKSVQLERYDLNETVIKTFREGTRYLFNYLFNRTSTSRFPISNPEYFDRYFALKIGIRSISEELVEQFRMDRASRRQIILKAIENSTIKALMEKLSKVSLDLKSIEVVLNWPPISDQKFVQSIDPFLKLIESIIGHGDFNKSFKSLLTNLRVDGDFNPARFYLIYYFLNHDANSEILGKYASEIRTHRIDLVGYLVSMLNKYKSDYIIFELYEHKSALLHKIFLASMLKYTPAEYDTNIKTYLTRSGNVTLLGSYLINTGSEGKRTIDNKWLKQLMSIEALTVLIERAEQMVETSLSQEEKGIVEFIIRNKMKLKKVIRSN